MISPAANDLALANKELIGGAIRRFGIVVNSDYTADDAHQDGWFGLVRAAERFDPARGFKFSTLAYRMILTEIRRGQARAQGNNLRSALRSGRDYEAPLSLDFDASGEGDGGCLGDTIAATDRVDDAAVARAQLAEVHELVPVLCRDDVERELMAALLDPDDHRTATALAEAIAESHGISRQAVSQRRVRLVAKFAHLIGPIGAAA